MRGEDKDAVLAAYTLVDKDSPDYAKFVKDYPVLEKEKRSMFCTKWRRRKLTGVNPILGKALLTVVGIEQVLCGSQPKRRKWAVRLAAST